MGGYRPFFAIGATVFIIGVALCFYRLGLRKGVRWSTGLLLMEYVGLIYCSTVIFRGTGKLEYNFLPFWSYLACFREENDGLLAENIMNVLVFIPVGILARIAFRGFSWGKALALGAGLSIGYGVYLLFSGRIKTICPFYTTRKNEIKIVSQG